MGYTRHHIESTEPRPPASPASLARVARATARLNYGRHVLATIHLDPRTRAARASLDVLRGRAGELPPPERIRAVPTRRGPFYSSHARFAPPHRAAAGIELRDVTTGNRYRVGPLERVPGIARKVRTGIAPVPVVPRYPAHRLDRTTGGVGFISAVVAAAGAAYKGKRERDKMKMAEDQARERARRQRKKEKRRARIREELMAEMQNDAAGPGVLQAGFTGAPPWALAVGGGVLLLLLLRR